MTSVPRWLICSLSWLSRSPSRRLRAPEVTMIAASTAEMTDAASAAPSTTGQSTMRTTLALRASPACAGLAGFGQGDQRLDPGQLGKLAELVARATVPGEPDREEDGDRQAEDEALDAGDDGRLDAGVLGRRSSALENGHVDRVEVA